MTLTREGCEAFIFENVFRLRPPSYGKNYPQWPGLVGLEIEMLPWIASSLKGASPIPRTASLFEKNNDDLSLTEILSQLAIEYPKAQKQYWDDHPKLLSLDFGEQGIISFEPGGQLEYSSTPVPCLSEALSRMEQMQDILRNHLARQGIELWQMGINPWQTVDEIGLQMNKPRYVAMDQYFSKIGPMGRRMMRQTCTLQVNLDFGPDETTLAKRFVLSNLAAPLLTAIFANSPFVNNGLSGWKSSRAMSWRLIDPARTGILPLTQITRNWSKVECVKAYLEHVLAAPVIFITARDYEVPSHPLTFDQWMTHGYKGCHPVLSDFETHLSLHFPEVRARGFLELRSIDSQSAIWQCAPALFVTAMLYSDKILEKALHLLLPYVGQMDEWLALASQQGLGNETIGDLSIQLTKIVCDELIQLPDCYGGKNILGNLHKFAENFTLRRRCPADDLVDFVRNEGGAFLPATFARLEDHWRALVN